MAPNLVFKTHNANVDTMYDFATILNKRGFTLNPKVKGLKMNTTKMIAVNLKEKVYTPTPYDFYIDSKNIYFIELKD